MARTQTIILALGAVAAFASFHGANSTNVHVPATASTGAPDSLLNVTADEVLARLGPPSYLGPMGGGFTSWVWQGQDGGKRSVTLYQDRVVTWAPEGLGEGAGAVELPKGAAYLGQRVEDLLSTLGRPDRAVGVPLPSPPISGPPPPSEWRPTLVFGDDWVGLHGGRVMSIGVAPQDKIHGPR